MSLSLLTLAVAEILTWSYPTLSSQLYLIAVVILDAAWLAKMVSMRDPSSMSG